MGGGFFAIDPDVWPAIRERLPKPLSREEAIVDLRWHQDRELQGGEEMPGYRTLGASWGWCEPGKDCKRARLLLQNEPEWSDPKKLTPWRARKGRSEGAARAHEGRSEGAPPNVATSNIEEKGRSEGAARAQAGRDEGDTREPLSSQAQTQTQAQGETRARATPPWSLGWPGHEPADVLAAVRAAAEAVRKASIPDDKLSADATVVGALWRGRGRPSLQALVAEVALVAVWAQEAPDSRNDLRGVNERGEAWGSDRSRAPSTVLRPDRFEERLSRATAWDRAGRPTGSAGPPARAAPKGVSSGADGVLSRLFSRRNTTGEANNG